MGVDVRMRAVVAILASWVIMSEAVINLKDSPDVYILTPDNFEAHLSTCHEDSSPDADSHCLWFVLFHKSGEDPVPIFEETAKEFHGHQLVHMAMLDTDKYPHFLKSRFAPSIREA